jgi:hypothetical protein
MGLIPGHPVVETGHRILEGTEHDARRFWWVEHDHSDPDPRGHMGEAPYVDELRNLDEMRVPLGAEEHPMRVIVERRVPASRPVQEGLRQELGTRYSLEVGQPMAFGKRNLKVERAESEVLRLGLCNIGREHCRHVDRSPGQGLEEWWSESRVDLDLGFGMPLGELLQNTLGNRRDPCGSRADLQQRGLAAIGKSDARNGTVCELDCEASLVEKRRPCVREIGTLTVADQELSIKRSLQSLDLLRQPWLGDTQSVGGTAEMLLFGHCYEIAKLSELHKRSSVCS